MRTIVAFLSLTAALAAQSPIENLTKEIAANPDNADARARLLNVLRNPDQTGSLAFDQVLEMRRDNVLWLIEHQPDFRNWIGGEFLIPPRGVFADPQGYAQSVELWNRAAWSSTARPDAMANAALYLKATDRKAARKILDLGLAKYPGNHALERALGVVDGAAFAGIDGLGQRGQFTTAEELRNSPESAAARKDIEDSNKAYLLTGAAQMLASGNIQNQFQLNFGDDDVFSLAERWLRRAIELAPDAGDIKTQLAPVLRTQANRSEDPEERARLFAEAMSLAPDPQKPTFLPDLAQAEFESGDDNAARRDAGRALDAAEAVKANPNLSAQLINRGNTVLGRIALAHGDIVEARARLDASLHVSDPGPMRFNGPDLSLAQDLADAGERDVVLDYLEKARKLWIYDRGQLDRYIRLIKAGKKRDAFAFAPPANEFGPAPDFKLRALDGREWTLASLNGKTAALLFWNTSCPSCADQIAQFTKEAAALEVSLLALNIGDDESAIRAFVGKNRVSVPVLYGGGAALARQYHADAIPSVVIIDSQRRISQVETGAVPNARQVLQFGARRVAVPDPLPSTGSAGHLILAWRPCAGAQSYLVEWEKRDAEGWPSDRDGFLRVIPTRGTQVELDATGEIRWRVYAVGFGTKSAPGAWQTIQTRDLQ